MRPVSVVIATFQREQVLIETIEHLLRLSPAADEILIIDQTRQHNSRTTATLENLHNQRSIRWIRMEKPSITAAMNLGLREARNEVVLFVDDDIVPDEQLIAAHHNAHHGFRVVAGQVLQPGQVPSTDARNGKEFMFNSTRRQVVPEFIGCNFSVNRSLALSLGGFDENFLHVAYRYEAEFADRVTTAGEQIVFEPAASVRHLKAQGGGTRSFGHHLTTIRPSHAVGAYYFLLRSRNVSRRFLYLAQRPLRSIRTKHHATHPWWIPATLAAEMMGFAWAVFLYFRGPRLINWSQD